VHDIPMLLANRAILVPDSVTLVPMMLLWCMIEQILCMT
jgi:hypothetical protein